MKTFIMSLALLTLGHAASARTLGGRGAHFYYDCANANTTVYFSEMGQLELKTSDDHLVRLSIAQDDDGIPGVSVSKIVTIQRGAEMPLIEDPRGGSRTFAVHVAIKANAPETGDADLDRELRKGLQATVICVSASVGSPVPMPPRR